MTTTTSADVKNDILFAIRDGKFPAAFNDTGHSEAAKIAAIHDLCRQRYIVVTQLGVKETARGADFVLQSEDPQGIPKQAQLTVDGERLVDQKRGVDSPRLELAAKMTILQALSEGPVKQFDGVKMPDGIGPHRKAFLINGLREEGLIELKRERVQQGFFSVEAENARITPTGALELVRTKVQPDDLAARFKRVRRQLLLNALDGDQPVASAHTAITAGIPGWGAELLAAAVKPLQDAGLIVEGKQRAQQGFFAVEIPVLSLTDAPVVAASVVRPGNSALTVSNLSSGRRIAEAILVEPNLSVQVTLPASGNARSKPLTLTI